MKRKRWAAALLALLLAFSLSSLAENAPAADGAEQAAETKDPFGQDVVTDEMYSVYDYAVTEGLPDSWVNVLLLGTDSRSDSSYGYTDSIILLSINPAAKQAKLTSLMRDIWVTMDGRAKSSKLNTVCLMGGPALTVRTVNESFGMNIQYYVLANLSGMAKIIDLLGGLDLDVTAEELTALNQGLFDLSPFSGMEKLMEYGSDVHMNGNQATAYARIRKIDSDSKRTERQRTVLIEIARRLQQEDAGTIVGVVMKLLDCVETNLNLTQLMTLAAVGLDIDLDGVAQLRLPAEGTYKSGTYTIDRKRVWCIKTDFTENTRLLHEFIYQ